VSGGPGKEEELQACGGAGEGGKAAWLLSMGVEVERGVRAGCKSITTWRDETLFSLSLFLSLSSLVSLGSHRCCSNM